MSGLEEKIPELRSRRRGPRNLGIQSELERELLRLKGRLGIDEGLEVFWSPNVSSELSGEVRGRMIYVYESDLEKAKSVLRHEFVDYLVSSAVQPYKEVANSLIKLLNERAYAKKEEVVEKISRILD